MITQIIMSYFINKMKKYFSYDNYKKINNFNIYQQIFNFLSTFTCNINNNLYQQSVIFLWV